MAFTEYEKALRSPEICQLFWRIYVVNEYPKHASSISPPNERLESYDERFW